MTKENEKKFSDDDASRLCGLCLIISMFLFLIVPILIRSVMENYFALLTKHDIEVARALAQT